MTINEFEILSRSLRPRLLRKANSILGNSDDAEDVVQDAMLKLWSMRSSLHQLRSVEAFALLVTRNLSINVLRSKHIGAFAELEEADSMGEIDSPEQIYIRREEADYVDSVLQSLPDSQQALIRLRHIDGYDNTAIAALLGSSEGSVRTALSRARKHVAEIISAQFSPKI